MRLWKVLGLAAFAGVAATGVVIARAERRRRAYTPQEIRERLHTRLAEAAADPPVPVPPGGNRRAPEGPRHHRIAALSKGRAARVPRVRR